MPKRFLDGVIKPKAFPLGLIGSCRMDPAHGPFVRKAINEVTWGLANVEILVLGLKTRLSYSMVGGIEEVGKRYAGIYWYDVRIYREIVNKDAFDQAFAKDAKGFVVFDDGSEIVKLHRKLVRVTGKPVKTFKLPEED